MRLAVVGFSTRALAQAVAALGCEVVAIDHFCDRDTIMSSGNCIAITDWPNGIVEAVANLDVDGILLAGGMENLLTVIEKLAETGKLLGMPQSSIAKLRELRFLSNAAQGVGIGFPEFTDEPAKIDQPNDWLWKPRQSAGGLGIRTKPEISHAPSSRHGYWQRRVHGRSLGVSCIVSQKKGTFIGATQSLTCDDCPGPEPVIYSGSVGPVELVRQQIERIEQLCCSIAGETPLIGWLQFDFIEADDGRLWLIECNPRWTSGMEILRVSGLANMAELHLNASLSSDTTLPINISQTWSRWAGKAVYYAGEKVLFSQELRATIDSEFRAWSAAQSARWNRAASLVLSDIPAGEQVFDCGHPVVTSRVHIDRLAGDTEREALQLVITCLEQAREIITRVMRRAVTLPMAVE